MEKEFIIFNLVTRQFYCGDYETIFKWSKEHYNIEFYFKKEYAERCISTFSDGLYQVIEVYRP